MVSTIPKIPIITFCDFCDFRETKKVIVSVNVIVEEGS